MYNLVVSLCYNCPTDGPQTETCWTNLKQDSLTQLVLQLMVFFQLVSGSLIFVQLLLLSDHSSLSCLQITERCCRKKCEHAKLPALYLSNYVCSTGVHLIKLLTEAYAYVTLYKGLCVFKQSIVFCNMFVFWSCRVLTPVLH